MFARSCRSAVSTIPAASTSASSSATPTTSHQLIEPAYVASIVHGRSVRQPHYLPKTHSIPAATLHFRSYHPHTLYFLVHFANHTASALGVPLSHPVHLPTQRRLWTVLRGPFVHKKTHKRVVKAWDAHPDVVDMLVQYLQKHVAPGVGMRAVKWRRASVGVGQKTMESVVGHMRLDEQVPAEKVKALGEQIVQQELAAASAGAGAGAGVRDAVQKT
ncbi:hypothetical protein L227DRAFT_587249 [Lentinus tigrinus ALCF2SS1-6]|uniref:Small ribosomal subunit protein uS10 domain-containing protein n=1 Tax=Lentinus tigrinus ALCF2SS1-6 TaxID=1328759 RepID=A0A5C2S5K1_9APHY|nr:hypothetical protein L227DRAFT_587249 [Lentinus tigrinus ALCF2SS1-6]